MYAKRGEDTNTGIDLRQERSKMTVGETPEDDGDRIICHPRNASHLVIPAMLLGGDLVSLYLTPI